MFACLYNSKMFTKSNRLFVNKIRVSSHNKIGLNIGQYTLYGTFVLMISQDVCSFDGNCLLLL